MLSLENPGGVSLDILKNMINVLRHRGPDGKGIYIDDYIGIAHTRLSIIDIEGGAQPIHNENKTLWITYNGEVFNFPELRLELEKKGHRFYTNTDTEAVVHLFEEKGADFLKDLNGQFSLAIWDSKKKELFLARDRMGIRPLYYTLNKKTFTFASEIKSLFMIPSLKREIDPIAMEQVFTFWTTLPGRTVFKGINELPPGHFMKISNGKVQTHAFWEIPLKVRESYLNMAPEMIKERIMELLTDAVRLRLRSDVPVGAYLSGGLDSSGISSIIADNFNNKLNTFGIRFEEPIFDEGIHQKCMVNHLNVAHHEFMAKDSDIAEAFQNVVWHAETPILRTAPAPLYLLAKLVRKSGFKVVLTGEGADEVFGGYNIFREALVRKFWSRIPSSQARAGLIGHLYPHILQNPRLKSALQKFFAQGLSDTANPLYSHLIRWNNTGRIKTFFSDDLKKEIGGYNCYDDMLNFIPDGFDNFDCLSKAQYIEMRLFMSNYLLSSQGDRVAMAHSIEIRLPYLDYRIVEFMASVPSLWKIMGINEKHILKKVFKEILPKSITGRTKHPYRAPIQNCFFNNSPPEFVKEILSERAVKDAGLFDSEKINRLRKKAKPGAKISEVDSMGVAGVLSTMLLNKHFINFQRQYEQEDVPNCVFFDKRTVA